MKGFVKREIFNDIPYKSPLRDAKDFALFIIDSIEQIIVGSQCDTSTLAQNKKYFVVMAGKQKRIFVYIGNNKYYSTVFPFDLGDGYVRWKGAPLTTRSISNCETILNQMKGRSVIDVWEDSDLMREIDDIEAYEIVEYMLTTEPCYVRYDYDLKSAKGRESMHPAIHLDLNMGKGGTFKFGLEKQLSLEMFEHILDCEQERLFLHKLESITNKKNFKPMKKRKRARK